MEKDTKIAQLEKMVAHLQYEIMNPRESFGEHAQSQDDLRKRLRTTEEHLGEVRRDNQFLENEFHELETKLQKSQEMNEKLSTGIHDALDKISLYKNEKEYFEKLFESYKEKTEAELTDKDAKIAQQDKLISRLQSEIMYPKESVSLSDLAQSKDDLHKRLQFTEEHLGELRRDNLILQDELHDAETKLQQSQDAYKKLYTGMRDSLDKISLYKNEKEYFEKLYQSYKEKTQVEMLQKDAKIAQQDKLITHLQCRIAAPKKMCCWLPDKKPAGRLSLDDLGKALDSERAKNVDLSCMVRRLQQQLTERRMRRSFSEERLPMVNEN